MVATSQVALGLSNNEYLIMPPEVVDVEPDMTPTEPYVPVQHSLDTAGPYACLLYTSDAADE